MSVQSTKIWGGLVQRVDDVASRSSWKRCITFVTLQIEDEEYTFTAETATEVARSLLQFAKIAKGINR